MLLLQMQMQIQSLRVVLILLTAAAAATITTTAQPQQPPQNSASMESSANTLIPMHRRTSDGDFLTLVPLIPHHQAEQRRRRQLLSRTTTPQSVSEDHWWEERRLVRSTSPITGREYDYFHDSKTSDEVNRTAILHRWTLSDEEGARIIPKAFQVAALFQGYGTHYVDLWVGTPPQRQTVIVDTGSPVTAFPCSKCRHCGTGHHAGPRFIEHCSSTYQPLSCRECLYGQCSALHHFCHVGIRYLELSGWQAVEAQDMVYAGGLHSAPVTGRDSTSAALDPYHAPLAAFALKFGCQYSVSGLFRTQLADGILGMSQSQASFWRQLYDSRVITRRAFSLCYSRSPTASRAGTPAGAMSLGGAETALHQTPMVFTKPDTRKGRRYFYVKVRKAYLRQGHSGDSARNPRGAKIITLGDGPSLLNDDGYAVVDSGTTDTFFSKEFAPSFYAAFKELMNGQEYSTDLVRLTADELDSFPTILIQLEGDEERNREIAKGRKNGVVGLAGDLDPDHPYDVLLAIPPSHYFEYSKHDDVYAARFLPTANYQSIIGANSMMGHDILFDGDTMNIGWAESQCDYPDLVRKYVQPNFPTMDNLDISSCVIRANERINHGFCTLIACKSTGIAILIALGFAAFLRCCLWCCGKRRIRMEEPSYEKLSVSELEMQTPPSVLHQYRDDGDDDDLGDDDAKRRLS